MIIFSHESICRSLSSFFKVHIEHIIFWRKWQVIFTEISVFLFSRNVSNTAGFRHEKGQVIFKNRYMKLLLLMYNSKFFFQYFDRKNHNFCGLDIRYRRIFYCHLLCIDSYFTGGQIHFADWCIHWNIVSGWLTVSVVGRNCYIVPSMLHNIDRIIYNWRLATCSVWFSTVVTWVWYIDLVVQVTSIMLLVVRLFVKFPKNYLSIDEKFI